MAKRVALWIVIVAPALLAAGLAIGGPEARSALAGQITSQMSATTPALANWSNSLLRATERALDRNPAAVIGIAFGLALPFLGIASWVARRIAKATAAVLTSNAAGMADLQHGPLQSPGPGWLDVERPAPRRIALASEIHRIGRHADNDIRVTGPHIAETHALIRRTPEREFHFIDVSGQESPIVQINGEPRWRASLRDGDRISVGGTSVIFHAGRAATNTAPETK